MPLRINEQIPAGTRLKTVAGEDIKVLELISAEGGQGDVYKVSWKGGNYALKWYNRDGTYQQCTKDTQKWSCPKNVDQQANLDVVGSAQYDTICNLVRTPNPDPLSFKLPLVVVTEKGAVSKEDEKRKEMLFGYMMELLPDDHFEMKDFLRSSDDPRQKTFASFHAMIWAGMNIVAAIRTLHLKGMSYKDLKPDNIAINPETGHVWMIDCDNISVDGKSCTVNGTRGYMAPEIVRSGFRLAPNIQSDQFSLAIVLFRLFYMDHPMEGKLWKKFPLITEDVEDELYCIHPIYNMNPQDKRNRPDKTYAPNVERRMAILPDVLREGFERTFINGIYNIHGRTPENSWLHILAKARDQLVFLDPACKDDRVVRFNVKEKIPAGCLRMTIGKGGHELALYPMQSIFKDIISGDVGEYNIRIGRAGISKGTIIIQNLSGHPWEVYDPVAKKIGTVADNRWFRVLPGTQIQFDAVRKVIGKVDDPCR